MLVAPEVAQDLEQLRKGEGKEEIETWIKRANKVLKASPLINDLSDNLAAIAATLGIRFFEPEKEKERNQK